MPDDSNPETTADEFDAAAAAALLADVTAPWVRDLGLEDGDGSITVNELADVLKSLGQNRTRNEGQQMMNAATMVSNMRGRDLRMEWVRCLSSSTLERSMKTRPEEKARLDTPPEIWTPGHRFLISRVASMKFWA